MGSPQPFWHHGPVSWKTIFPPTGRRGWFRDEARALHLLCTQVFPGGSDGKESACNAGDSGLIPGLWGSPAEENDYPLRYSCLENLMDRGIWQATVHGVTKSRIQLSNWHLFLLLLHQLHLRTSGIRSQRLGTPGLDNQALCDYLLQRYLRYRIVLFSVLKRESSRKQINGCQGLRAEGNGE